MPSIVRRPERSGEVFSRREVALLADLPQSVADRAMAGRILVADADRARHPALRLLPEFAAPFVAVMGGLKLPLAAPVRRKLALTLAQLDLKALSEARFEIERGVWLDLSLLAYPAARRARRYLEICGQALDTRAGSAQAWVAPLGILLVDFLAAPVTGGLDSETLWALTLYGLAHGIGPGG
jgi:hypothetical protein